MITQDNLFAKQCSKLVVLVTLTTSIIGLTTQKTLAIPLEPILDQMGRRMIEGLVGTDISDQAEPQDNQSFTDEEEIVGSPQQYPAYPPSTHPPVHQSVYPPPAYSQGYIPYPPGSSQQYPAYPPSPYPPIYPQGQVIYPPGSPQYPAYAPPTYLPAYSPGYPPPAYSSPAPSPRQSATPIIINNF